MSSTTSSSRIMVIVTYEVGKQDQEAFERIAGAHAAAGDTYPGCLRFSLGRDILHPGRYQLIELWDSEATLQAHARSAAFRRTMQSWPTATASRYGRIDTRWAEPVGGRPCGRAFAAVGINAYRESHRWIPGARNFSEAGTHDDSRRAWAHRNHRPG